MQQNENSSLEKAYIEVSKLVKDFSENINFYKSSSYQEAEVRKDFIDKFFISLGWDVHHDIQKNPYEQEVKVERSVTVSGIQKRADYSFSLAPNYRDPKFFVEAKKPSHDLSSKDYYFQTIRYGWHKNTPLSILTDFEEFHILDCRYSPDISNVLSRLYKKYHYSEYIEKDKFAEIYWLFSREALLNNSLEKLVENLPKPKGKSIQKALFPFENLQRIDDDFLNMIELQREILAKALKKNDDSLNSDQLTEATQKIIDRLVFIRFLEDKLIEQEQYVYKFGETGSAWNGFLDICRKLDAKYNGIVFKNNFIDKEQFKGPIDSEFFAICQDICHLNSRFLFSEIPIHILGSIYERFLGQVVHATDKRVKIEPKPEVRKAGGVYYTPKYIVDYIIQKTVGILIEGKTPEEISKLRFIDIACGSGSFLIGVFEFLLDYHNKFYQNNPDKAKKDGCYKTEDGIWVLSIKQKQKILINNIYGVDLDAQAVEVTQLSLSLKMLEDETTATANEMQVLFHEKILPNMSRNIICGNSLVESDVYLNDIFFSDEEKIINPMDYSAAFPDIIRKGGFDAIVGNPPWVDIKELPPNHVKYYFTKYACSENRINLYALFIEKCLKLIKPSGMIGYIIPNSILYQSSYKKLRFKILNDFSIQEIIRLPDNTFKKVKAETVILTIKGNSFKSQCNCLIYDRNDKINSITEDNAVEKKLLNPETWLEKDLFVFDIYSTDNINALLKKIEANKYLFESLCDFCLGLTPYDKYKGHTKSQITDRVFHSKTPLNSTFKKLLAGGDIERYRVEWGNDEYISYGEWLGAPREKRFFTDERILVRQIVSGKPLRIFAGYTKDELYNTQSAFNILRKPNAKENIKYYLSILNSSLMNFFHSYTYLDLSKNLFQKILIQNCRKFPMKCIDFKNKSEVLIHDKLVSLVDQIINSKKEVSNSNTEKDFNYYNNKISALDKQIDNLVYELYGLTQNEIEIIENYGMNKA